MNGQLSFDNTTAVFKNVVLGSMQFRNQFVIKYVQNRNFDVLSIKQNSV